MRHRLTFVLGLTIGMLFTVEGMAQGKNELFQAYTEALLIEDVTARDSQVIRTYGDFALNRVNARDEATEKYIDTLALKVENSLWPKAPGVLWHTMGRWYDVLGDKDQSLQYFNMAIESLKDLGPGYYDLSTAMIGAGFILLNTGLHTESLEMFKKAIPFVEASGDFTNQWKVTNFLGDYYYYSAFRQENFDSALHYYVKGEEIVKQNNMWGYFKAANQLGLANVYRRIGREKLSEEYFQKSLTEAEKHNNSRVIFALYNDKAEVLEKSGKLREALEMKKESYKYVLKTGNIDFIARSDRQLYQTYRSLNDFQRALKHYENFIELQDSLNMREARERYVELEKKYESEQKEREIEELRSANLLLARNSFIGLSILALLLFAYIARHNRRLRKQNTELEAKNREIMLAQMKGQNLERRRMATELHDNLNTKIAAIRWQLEAVAPAVADKAQKVINKTLELVNDVYGDVRLISHNLMPEKVETLGLIKALENLLGQLKQNNKVAFHLVVNTPPNFSFGSLTYPLYNIIFEMINNILKHAEAENGWISISEGGDQILLTVSDDGKGFDIDQMTNGYGIRNITSRLENIKGKWKIESAPGEGTRFFIEIPRID